MIRPVYRRQGCNDGCVTAVWKARVMPQIQAGDKHSSTGTWGVPGHAINGENHCQKYEGRSINKLQNGAIPLILKIGKIRNIRFVGNLILKIHINFF